MHRMHANHKLLTKMGSARTLQLATAHRNTATCGRISYVGRYQKMQKSYQPRFWKISYWIMYFQFCLFFRFVDKFTEFLGSFVKSHLRRFESNAQFPILVFLNVLFKYTFEQQRTESYLACLDVWNVCVDYVQGLISSRVPEADVIVPKYRG